MRTFEYHTRRIALPEGELQTYSFGTGDKIIFAFPSFPHSGLLYILFTKFYDSTKYKFITFDLPGWAGWSDDLLTKKIDEVGRVELEDYIKLAEVVMKEYKVDTFSTIGYSFGGNLALRLALKYPTRVKNVVIVSAILFGSLTTNSTQSRLIRMARKLRAYSVFRRQILKQFKKLILQIDFEAGETLIDMYRTMYERMDGKNILEGIYTLFTDPGDLFRKQLSQLPRLLVVSSREEESVFRRQAWYLRKIVDHEKTMFIHGSHSDFILKPKSEVVRQVMQFLLKETSVLAPRTI